MEQLENRYKGWKQDCFQPLIFSIVSQAIALDALIPGAIVTDVSNAIIAISDIVNDGGIPFLLPENLHRISELRTYIAKGPFWVADAIALHALIPRAIVTDISNAISSSLAIENFCRIPLIFPQNFYLVTNAVTLDQ